MTDQIYDNIIESYEETIKIDKQYIDDLHDVIKKMDDGLSSILIRLEDEKRKSKEDMIKRRNKYKKLWLIIYENKN